MYGYEFRHEHGHIVIYKNGKFYGTAQSMSEAIQDIREEEREEAESE